MIKLGAVFSIGFLALSGAASAACNPSGAPAGSAGCQPVVTSGTSDDTVSIWQPHAFPGSANQIAPGNLLVPANGTTQTLGAWMGYLSGTPNPNSTAQNGVAAGVLSAACDGSTNDTAAFTTAIAAYKTISLPPGKTCLVNSLVLTGGQTLDCQGSTLQPYSATGWIIKKTGFHSVIRNCIFNDPNGYTEQATTLARVATPGATTITVASSAGMTAGEPISITLDSGASWLTKIAAGGISGNVVTLQDAIPYSATAIASIGAGGTGYAAADALVVQGGEGPPITISAAVSGGALTGGTLAAPGLYSSAPPNPAAVFDGQNSGASGATVNITYSGASSGAVVEATLGTLVLDQATQGEATDITWSSVPAGLGIYNTGSSVTNWTAGERVNGFFVNAAKLFGIFRDVGISNTTISNGVVYGATHGASSYGVAGVYLNAENVGAAPPGGNHIANVNTLNWETGYQDNAGQLDFFDAGDVSDTISNYAFSCNGCVNNTFSGTPWLAFTGPSAISGTAGYGIGLYLGNSAINNSFAALATSNNAADIHIADMTTSLWLGPWSSSKKLSGIGSSLQTGVPLFSASTPAGVLGSGAAGFLGGGGYSTTEGLAESLNTIKGVINSFTCTSGVAPGAGQSYTCYLRVNEVTRAFCSWTGASSYSCTYAGAGVSAFLNNRVDVQISTSASAPATQFRAYATQQ